MRIPIAAALSLAVLTSVCQTPAIAWDADPEHFRADPQAWVRSTLMPGCKAPADAATVASCNCMVPILATQTTEADVARVNDPEFGQKYFSRVALGAGLLCMPRKP
jgi:hypothetical protein